MKYKVFLDPNQEFSVSIFKRTRNYAVFMYSNPQPFGLPEKYYSTGSIGLYYEVIKMNNIYESGYHICPYELSVYKGSNLDPKKYSF